VGTLCVGLCEMDVFLLMSESKDAKKRSHGSSICSPSAVAVGVITLCGDPGHVILGGWKSNRSGWAESTMRYKTNKEL